MPSKQAALEAEMARLGTTRFHKKNEKARKGELESTTLVGRRLLGAATGNMVEAIADWIKVAERRPGPNHRALHYINMLPPQVVAGLSCTVVLDCISHKKLYTATAMRISSILEDECRARYLQKHHGSAWGGASKIIRKFQGYSTKRRHVVKMVSNMRASGETEWANWPKSDKAKLGVLLIELIKESTGLVEVFSRMTVFGKKVFDIEATEATLKWIEAANADAEVLTPLYLPCVEVPKPWTAPDRGGFHTSNLWRSKVMKTWDRKHIEQELENCDLSEVFQSLNTLQNTAWRVNKGVYEVFKYLWDNSYTLAGLPSREDLPIPPRPADIATNEAARMQWRRATAAIRDGNCQSKTQRLAIAKIMNVAMRFGGAPFWFVHQLDWRGRAYPVAYHLHPQGPDHCKAMLEFHEGAPIDSETAWQWHRVHGANAWGLSKASIDERVAWVMENEPRVLGIGRDPLGDLSWMDADEPWQFLAWCIDYAKCVDNEDHISHLPIHQDATQSGIQIMSLLLRDEVGGRATNCIKSDSPQDLYAAVATRVEELLAEDGSPLALFWLEFGIERGCTKRPVMTRVYNATKFSCGSYVREWADLKAAKLEIDIREIAPGEKPYWFLTEIVWSAIDEVTVGTALCQEWMREVAKVFNEYQQPIRWTSPVGLPIRQYYCRYRSREIKTRIGKIIRQVRINVDRDAVNKGKMSNALAPNVVHSLDAAAMMETVNQGVAAGITSFAAVHDSFATLACDSDKLAKSIRQAYIKIFSRDVLSQLKQEWKLTYQMVLSYHHYQSTGTWMSRIWQTQLTSSTRDMREKFTTPKGELAFPAYIDAPDFEFNEHGDFVARQRFRKDDPAVLEFIAKYQQVLDQHIEETKQLSGKKQIKLSDSLPWTDELDGESGEPTGYVQIRTKLKHHCKSKKTGNEWDQTVKVFAPGEMKPMTDIPRIGPGSIVQIAGEVNCWNNNALGCGITLWCYAVLVHELVTKSSNENAEDFGFDVDQGDAPFATSETGGDGDY